MPLLTYAEASSRLAVSQPTMRAWVHRNWIPYVRISKRTVRFEEAEIDAFIARRRKLSHGRP